MQFWFVCDKACCPIWQRPSCQYLKIISSGIRQMATIIEYKRVFSWNRKWRGLIWVDKEDRELNGSSIPHLPANRLARPLAFPGSRGQNECSSHPIVTHKKRLGSHTHKHTALWFIQDLWGDSHGLLTLLQLNTSQITLWMWVLSNRH